MQPSLFDFPAPLDTSIQAHEKVKPKKRESYARILEIVRRRGNATLKEICADLGKERNLVSGRLTEMRGLSLLRFAYDELGEPLKREGCRVLEPGTVMRE